MADATVKDQALELHAELKGHLEARVWQVAWSSTGESLASCGEDKTIRLWGKSSMEGSLCRI